MKKAGKKKAAGKKEIRQEEEKGGKEEKGEASRHHSGQPCGTDGTGKLFHRRPPLRLQAREPR